MNNLMKMKPGLPCRDGRGELLGLGGVQILLQDIELFL